MTQNNEQHLEALQQIRTMMEKSSRFISLSGLSGVFAGLIALMGAAVVYVYLGVLPFVKTPGYYIVAQNYNKWGIDYRSFFLLVAMAVLVVALAGGIFFTTRKARANGQKIWDALTQRLLINLFIPLSAGGIFCLGLMYHGLVGLIAPSTLIFYGLALLNASKYTFNDIRYLGICEILLGLFGIFFLGYGLDLWALGFGVLHIVYGMVMYWKYERTARNETQE